MTSADTSWMAAASCREVAPETFFPDDGGGVEVARRVCARCPVRDECLEFALSHHIAHGVWGGKSERARQRLAAARRTAAREQEGAAMGARDGAPAVAAAAGTRAAPGRRITLRR